MKSSLRQFKFAISLTIIGMIITLIFYRPGAYYYLAYDSSPLSIEFKKNNHRPVVIDGVIDFGYEFSYGTGKTIFTKSRFSIFGYETLNKFIYKLSERKIAICNSKFLGNCLFSEGDEVIKFSNFLKK